MRLLYGEILANKKYGENLLKLEVFSPYICRNCLPGQFINVKCAFDGVLDPLLRRPFSIYEIDKKFNVFSILYVVKGKGTDFLKRLDKGDVLDFLGPLGEGFKADEEIKNYLLLGGGIGVAPLCLIAKELSESGKNIFFLAGFKDETFFFWERDLIKIVRNYKIFTENGSFGEKGIPAIYLKENLHLYKDYKFIVCGPKEMLKNIQGILKGFPGISAEALMEERMACGVGVCMGCVVKIKKSPRSVEYKKVCSDGPIFNLMEVVFD
jgi:2-polyprenylphenol hydroxylase and related flavodoxin oxidoreductases